MNISRCTKIWVILWLFLQQTLLSLGQQNFIGKREIVNYSKIEYSAGSQNWAIKQDSKERIYFANNEGLLVYNGTNWQLYPIPNNTILRSIEYGYDGKLFAGAQDELGYFLPDENGRYIYQSLKNLLPETEKNFSDVWEIVSFGKEVFFRTDYKIFRLSGDRIIIHPPISTWLSLRRHQDHLIGHDKKAGLLTYNNGRWETFIENSDLPPEFFITDIIPFGKDTSLISTPKNGLFLLIDNKLVPFILSAPALDQHQHFTSLTTVDEETFLAGTYNNGFYHINKKGKVLENINTKDGLQNNTIRCLYTDKAQNVWLGLDNGISFIAYNNAIKHIKPPAFNNGGGYAVTSFDNSLYFALSTGLYRLPFTDTSDFSITPDRTQVITGGQTWNLSVVNDDLLAGRDDGCWLISGSLAKNISAENGYWIFQQLPDTAKKIIAAGNYYGIRLFEKRGNDFKDAGSIANFSESARYLVTDDKYIWVSHPYRGVYKINLSDFKVSLYTDKQGLPSSLNNQVFKIRGRMVVATTEGVYEYNETEDKMVYSDTYKNIFGKKTLRYLKEDKDGNIWFIEEKIPGVVDISSSNPTLVYIPELKNRVLSGFENIYTFNRQNILIGGEEGFYHINYEKYRKNIMAVRTYISTVKFLANKDSIIYGGYDLSAGKSTAQTGKDILSIPYKWNSIQFSFYSSLYGQQANAEYSYYLEGFDRSWSEWSKKTEKEYTNLPPGNYTFRIKARSNFSNVSEETTFSVKVIPPWYKTTWAYLSYIAGFLLILFYLFNLQERKHLQKQEKRRLADLKKYEEEQKQMAYQHQLEIEKSEKELIHLQNEKLENEIEHKNTQLASTAMNLVQKKEFILKIKEELNHLVKNKKDKIETADLKKISKILTDEENLNEEWEQFSIHFDKVHGDFLLMLKEQHPDLKPHELKLCAYLRMNMSSKEIAQLMGISVRGVEISRYRLRKKLKIPTEVNLFQFLIELQTNKK